MHIFTFSRYSRRLLHYGIFAVLCHAVGILLLALASEYTSAPMLYHRFFPMLEHSLMSFSALLVGVLGIEYIEKKK